MIKRGQSRLTKATGALAEQCSVFSFVNDSCFITKTGAIGAIIEVEGIDYECLDQRALDSTTKRLEAAFKLFGPESDDEKADDAQALPPLSQGQNIAKRKAELKEGKTTPPKPYDDASLLTAMKNARSRASRRCGSASS